MTVVQLSISFAGAASVRGAQITGGSAAVSALDPRENRAVTANTAAAANGGTDDRMAALDIGACWGDDVFDALSPKPVRRFEEPPIRLPRAGRPSSRRHPRFAAAAPSSPCADHTPAGRTGHCGER